MLNRETAFAMQVTLAVFVFGEMRVIFFFFFFTSFFSEVSEEEGEKIT